MIDWLYFTDGQIHKERLIQANLIECIVPATPTGTAIRLTTGSEYYAREEFHTIRERLGEVAVRGRKRYIIKENPNA